MYFLRDNLRSVSGILDIIVVVVEDIVATDCGRFGYCVPPNITLDWLLDVSLLVFITFITSSCFSMGNPCTGINRANGLRTGYSEISFRIRIPTFRYDKFDWADWWR